jgi:hypothetical protein
MLSGSQRTEGTGCTGDRRTGRRRHRLARRKRRSCRLPGLRETSGKSRSRRSRSGGTKRSGRVRRGLRGLVGLLGRGGLRGRVGLLGRVGRRERRFHGGGIRGGRLPPSFRPVRKDGVPKPGVRKRGTPNPGTRARGRGALVMMSGSTCGGSRLSCGKGARPSGFRPGGGRPSGRFCGVSSSRSTRPSGS